VQVFQPKRLKKKKPEKIQAWTGIEPMTSANTSAPVFAEVMGSIPIQAWIFSGFFFLTA